MDLGETLSPFFLLTAKFIPLRLLFYYLLNEGYAMDEDVKKLSAFAVIALATILSGANHTCCKAPVQATCYEEDCSCYYCLGPDLVNPPVRPKTCDGDIAITIAGLAWRAEQDGMEYAIRNRVVASDTDSGNHMLNNLIEAKYETPAYHWEWGFKLGLGYAGCHDGWDVGAVWTHFKDRSSTHIEEEKSQNGSLLPLWSGFQAQNAGDAPILFAEDIVTNWKLNLNLIDIELGREFWTSTYLSIRPHMGLRIAYIDQDFDLTHRGGSWSIASPQCPLNDFVHLENDFKGVGVRTGLDTTWNVGCGWGFYGNFALSAVYGKFQIKHRENVRAALAPFSKIRLLETNESFRVSRAMADLGLGVQWSTFFCNCCYAFTAMLGWEQHFFFHQNQMWRVVRQNGSNSFTDLAETQKNSLAIFNNSGENIYHQRRGNLSTEGVTLRINFAF
ncbi:MAG: hypothetical protein KR126chlam1_00503 [Chlamydiae bacterium]|nr:hypothetical protein [Chlamydiota bacterium]